MPGEGNFTNERSSFCSDTEDQRGGVCVCVCAETAGKLSRAVKVPDRKLSG